MWASQHYFRVERHQCWSRVRGWGPIAEVPADRSHYLDLRGAKGSTSFGKSGVSLLYLWRGAELTNSGESADQKCLVLIIRPFEFRQVGDINNASWRPLLHLHPYEEIGASGKHLGVSARLLQEPNRFFERCWLHVLEPVHKEVCIGHIVSTFTHVCVPSFSRR